MSTPIFIKYSTIKDIDIAIKCLQYVIDKVNNQVKVSSVVLPSLQRVIMDLEESKNTKKDVNQNES